MGVGISATAQKISARSFLIALLAMCTNFGSLATAEEFKPGPHPECVYPDPYTFVRPHEPIERVQELPMDYAGQPIRWVFIDFGEDAETLVLSCDGRVLAQEQEDRTSTNSVGFGPLSPHGYTVKVHRQVDQQGFADVVSWLTFENGKIVHLWEFPIEVFLYWPGGINSHWPKSASTSSNTRVRSRIDDYDWKYSSMDDSIEVRGIRTLNLRDGGESRVPLPSAKFCFRAEVSKFVACGGGSKSDTFGRPRILEGN